MKDGVFAAIDVGTNATRLKLARRRSTGTLENIHSQRDPVRPGEGVFKTGRIIEPVANRLIHTLREYSDMCRLYGAEVRAVATSALREAANREEVVERARLEAGVTLEVISGREEARLVCLGVLEGASPAARSLCIDIGGGSTEVALALGEHPTGLWSLGLGTVRMNELIDGKSETTVAELERMRTLAAEAVALLPRKPSDSPLPNAIGCSGTVRALISFATGESRTYATQAELSRTVDELVELSAVARRKLFEPRRADIIVGGAVILEALCKHLSIETLRATKRGLRDGILIDLVRQKAATPRFHRNPRPMLVAE